MSVNVFSNMVGRVMTNVTGDVGDDVMVFEAQDGSRFTFVHHQDCCESVSIEDICGDLSDLVGVPLSEAEEVSSDGRDEPEIQAESYTWTFYRFASPKGTVTVRWLGTSNGYYGEGVYFEESVSNQ